MDADLVALAEAYGVATWYEDWQRQNRDVSAESVIGVLGLLGVDASSPAAVGRARPAVPPAREQQNPPGRVVVRRGGSRPLAPAGRIVLEDGSEIAAAAGVPGDLPLG